MSRLTGFNNLLFQRLIGGRKALPSDSKTLIWMIGGYDFNFALSSAFINIFLFKAKDDWTVVELYNMVSYAAIMLAFWVGGHLAKRVSHLLPYRLGFTFNAMVFLMVLVLREQSPEHPCFLGFFAGLGIGFYYLGQHSLTLDLTHPSSRDYFLSLSLFLSSILRILAPALGGWVILSLNGAFSMPSLGYYTVFVLNLILYVWLIYKSFGLRVPPVHGKFEFWKVLIFKGNRDWNRQMWAQFILGLRNGVFWFVVNILMYRVSKNEGIVGNYNMFTNFLAVLTAYSLSLWAGVQNRRKGLMVSALLTLGACGFLAAKINYFTLFSYAILSALGVTWFMVTFNAFAFEIIEGARESRKYKLEYLTARELPLWIGRALGLGGFMTSQYYVGEVGLRWSILVLGFTQMGVFLCLPARTPRDLSRKSKTISETLE